jgi:serine/threonine-protein kinase
VIDQQNLEAPKLAQLKYVVSSILFTGPKEKVMLVVDKRVERGLYALKVLSREGPEDNVTIERARAEFEASGKVNHPSILKEHDFRLRRSWFRIYRAEVLMEYVDGKSLDALKELPIGASILVFQKVASALAHMHRRGVLHGNLRPNCVMLSRTGHVKVRGYGTNLIRKPYQDQLKVASEWVAPEQAKKGGVVTEKTDIYALGVLMYHVLTGQVPGGVFGRSEGRKVSTPSSLNPNIPDPLNGLIIECLQSKLERRPPDMYEAVQRLEKMAQEMKLSETELRGLTVEEPA